MWSVAFHEKRDTIIFIQLSLWNDIFTLKQGMYKTQINLPIHVDIFLTYNVFQLNKTLIFRELPLKFRY